MNFNRSDYGNFIDKIEEIVLLSDLDTSKILYANEAFFKKTGYNHYDLQELRIIDISQTRPDIDSWYRYIEYVRENKGIIGGVMLTKDGKKVATETLGKIVTLDSKEYLLSELQAVSYDNVFKKYLHHGTNFYEALLENSFQGISVIDSEAQLTYLNSDAIKILNYSESLIQQSVFKVIHPLDREEVQEVVKEILERPGITISSNFKIIRGSGEIIDIECNSVNLLDDPNIHGIVTCFRDVTEQNQLEMLRIKHRTYLQNIMNTLPIMVWAKDVNGGFTWANNMFAQTFGMSASEILGKNEIDLGIKSNEAEHLIEIDRIVGITGEPKGPYEESITDIFTGKERWYETTKSPLANGDSIEVIGTAVEITERRKAETQIIEANQQLLLLNEELDRFVYSASHELRTPLTSAIGILNILEDEKDAETVENCTRLLKLLAKQMAKTLHSLADFSVDRGTELNIEAINFTSLILDTGDYIQNKYNLNKIHFHHEINQEVEFFTDRRRLAIIIQHLLSNAFQFLNPEIEMPIVKYKVTVLNDYATIEVSDNGIGIDQKQIDYIFKMFYRGSSQSKGAGLGLYITKNIVDKLQGKIEVYSTNGNGSTFIVTLPSIFTRHNKFELPYVTR